MASAAKPSMFRATKRKQFLFEKTAPRPRLSSGHTVAVQKPWEIKVFCALFFKKALLSSSSAFTPY
jgi:hypothetical protein